ncbi:Hypothetical protein CINCED_3A022431 [Cinara cedri]|uniref:Uncharacterized protein n=1 Tax=Cinara cedri TaxID=506608 RepID=A0A5E4NL77_9HEMI|nr:Hypothetical protein CINCED_3A022431 [Cinara cedri]
MVMVIDFPKTNAGYKSNGAITNIGSFKLDENTKIEIHSVDSLTSEIDQPVQYLLTLMNHPFSDILDDEETWNDYIKKGKLLLSSK